MSILVEPIHSGSRIRRLQHRFLPFNMWWVETDAGCWLVDTGLPGFPGQLLATVRSLLAGRPLLGILITHAHPDHTGALREAAAATGAPVWAHPLEALVLKGGAYPPLGSWAERLLPPVRLKESIAEVRALADGQEIGPFVALHTPGHAPGHLAFHHVAEQALICGDVFMSLLPWLTGPVWLVTYDRGLNRASQQRLRTMQPVSWLLPSHGRPQQYQAGMHGF